MAAVASPRPVGRRLSARRMQVVAGLARGESDAEIGRALFVSASTVRNHIRLAAVAAGVRGSGRQAALVDFAYRTGQLAGLAPEVRREVRLSPRMREILPGLARGLSCGQIAVELGVSVETVRTHVRRLHRVLRARSRAHAVALAWQHGFLGGDVGRGAA